jgi:hypothetical protein
MPIAISFENSPRHEARPHPPINVASPALRMRHRMYSCTHFLHVILHLTAAYRMRRRAFREALRAPEKPCSFFPLLDFLHQVPGSGYLRCPEQ